MSKYLVVGGAGFIGSNIVQTLLWVGHKVRVLDNLSTGRIKNLNKFINSDSFDLIVGDIRSQTTCNRACEGMDYVIFQSALKSVSESFDSPELYNDVNINGLLCMLKASVNFNIKKFVFASSSSVYGDSKETRLVENQNVTPISPYALTKLMGEYYCKMFSQTSPLKTVCLRYFNVYGDNQSLQDDYAVVIPNFIGCLLKKKTPLIFGNGEQSRDFINVFDVAKANITACEENLKHEVINVGSGEQTTILNLVLLLNKIIGTKIPAKFLPVREGDVFTSCSNPTKYRELLNPDAMISLEEGLLNTVNYFKKEYYE